MALGQQIHQFIVSKIPVYDNLQVSSYVAQLGKRLTQSAEKKNAPYQFIVLRDDRIYATSSPGGFIYVTTGYLVFMDNEAELSALLAHEIGESQFRSYRSSRVKPMLEKAIAGGAVAAPFFGSVGALAILGMMGVYSMVDDKPNDDKLIWKSDKFALKALVEGEQDPQGLIDLLRKLSQPEARELMYLYDYFQIRPVNTARIKKAENAFLDLNLKEKTFDVNRHHYQKMMEPVRTAHL